MGLSDVAVSRLSTTWDKLPSKSRKQFTEYETLIDPSRNHRAYRITVGKLPSPMIPFMPLLIKGKSLLYRYKPINLYSTKTLYINTKHYNIILVEHLACLPRVSQLIQLREYTKHVIF